MDFIIFKNTRVSSRQEQFGGVVKYNGRLFILDKNQYRFLSRAIKYKTYSQLNRQEKIIANNLIQKEILLKIDTARAKQIITEIKKHQTF